MDDSTRQELLDLYAPLRVADVRDGMDWNNMLHYGVKRGAVGYISNGGVRDTDEVILQAIPFWSRFDAKDVPVAVGGVAVYPGDMVVADGDGVIVVPGKLAYAVAEYAHRELANDKDGRRQLYVSMGRDLDDTVR